MNLLQLSRKARARALSIIPEITEINMLEKAALAMKFMRQAAEYKGKSLTLFGPLPERVAGTRQRRPFGCG